ncbi:MAG: matrixin family metalloprotease [Acidobacteriota bacterium]|nr:matrixin family metalloprotease [Acidobacteriota bacterium]
MKNKIRSGCAIALAIFYATFATAPSNGYTYNEIVPDVRQPASLSGGSACPVRSHIRAGAASRTVQWSTALGTNPLTIITQEQSADGRLAEIEQVITQSIGVWSSVSGATLQSVPAGITPTPTQNACAADGLNSICFNQADLAFTPGVLAFSRVITADRIGVQIGFGSPSTEVGEILDADIYFNPSDSRTTYATPPALPATPAAYDLESVLIHELGHTLGFSHSAIWNAMMFPFAPTPGTFSGARPSLERPDAPLGEDDRTGLRVLYPDAADTLHLGSIRGQVFNANPLSLPLAPPGVTGVFGSQVVAVDAESGAVVAATIGGWSCAAAGPAQFDGTYTLERLPVGHGYLVYAEPLNGAVDPSQIGDGTTSLCRNSTTDGGWPILQSCVVPPVSVSFTLRTRPGP